MDVHEEFNVLLDESFVVISEKNRKLAEQKRSSALRGVTRCISKSTQTRNLIAQTCPEDQAASWNPVLVATQCETLHKDHANLYRQHEWYQIWADAAVEILEVGPAKEAQKKDIIKQAKKVTDENTLILNCLANYELRRTPAPVPAAAGTASVTPAVKPEKELKPDKQLDVSDTARDFERWLEQYSVYHTRSNFAHAKPIE